MIKLKRPDKPVELTNDKEKELTSEFKKTGKAVWRKPYITKALKEMSHNKCAFCETKLGTQARELQVEHFHYKDEYPDEVVKWTNLLPACRQCNSNKGIIDTYKTPFIDPSVDNPKDYLYLKNCMIRSKDNDVNSKGRKTVDRLQLNHRERLVNPRLTIYAAMQTKLADIHNKAVSMINRADGKQYNRGFIINGLKDILIMAQPDAEYSAFMATIILDEEDYLETKEILCKLNLWDDELDNLHKIANTIKLDTNR